MMSRCGQWPSCMLGLNKIHTSPLANHWLPHFAHLGPNLSAHPINSSPHAVRWERSFCGQYSHLHESHQRSQVCAQSWTWSSNLLEIYAPYAFPYQIRTLSFLFWFLSFINSYLYEFMSRIRYAILPCVATEFLFESPWATTRIKG